MSKEIPKDEQIAFCFIKIRKAKIRYHADIDIHMNEDDIQVRKAMICALTDTAEKLLKELKDKNSEKEERK